MWKATDLSISPGENATDHPILTVNIETPAGQLKVMAAPESNEDRVVLYGRGIQGMAAYVVGWPNLRMLADAGMEQLGIAGIAVE